LIASEVFWRITSVSYLLKTSLLFSHLTLCQSCSLDESRTDTFSKKSCSNEVRSYDLCFTRKYYFNFKTFGDKSNSMSSLVYFSIMSSIMLFALRAMPVSDALWNKRLSLMFDVLKFIESWSLISWLSILWSRLRIVLFRFILHTLSVHHGIYHKSHFVVYS